MSTLSDFSPQSQRILFIGCVLIATIWAINLMGIDSFPPFIDEMVHIHGSEQAYKQSILTNSNLGRQFTIWWMMLFQAHLGSPIWIGRVATLLAVLPGVAAMMGIGRLMAGVWGAALTGLFYLLSTYHLFFGRLALSDPIATSAVLLAIYFAYRLSRRAHWSDAILCGVFLFVAVGAKVSVLPYFGVPIAAALTLRPNKRPWRQQIQWGAAALGTATILLIIFVGGLMAFGHDYFSNSVSYALTNRGATSLQTLLNPGRIANNVSFTINLLGGYFGAALVGLVAAVLVLLFKRRFYLPLCLLAPLLIIWINQIQESRFLVTGVSILLVCGGVATALILQNRPRSFQFAVLAVIAIWGILVWMPFTRAAIDDQPDLPLPQVDLLQYVYSDASGFGFREVKEVLQSQDTQQTIGLLANCQGLRMLSIGQLTITCPTLKPNQEMIAELEELIEKSRAPGVYAVVEQLPYVPQEVEGNPIAVIERPGGGPTLTIYDLSPSS